MIRVRKSAERGRANHGWLDTRHTFSFDTYQDANHMRFRALRVINEDVVAPGRGFGMHPHRDMEIVTYVLSGALQHRDSLGNGSVLKAGELQQMTAGTGIQHSEFNPSLEEPVHLYQIWLFPSEKGLAPGYDQRAFFPADRQDRWQTVVTPDGRNESLRIHQDATIHLADVSTDSELGYALAPDRHAWLQVLRGNVDLHGHALAAGDGAAIGEESQLTLQGRTAAEVMLFDLA